MPPLGLPALLENLGPSIVLAMLLRRLAMVSVMVRRPAASSTFVEWGYSQTPLTFLGLIPVRRRAASTWKPLRARSPEGGSTHVLLSYRSWDATTP